MKIHPAQQHSLEWLAARSGIVTASEMKQILTPNFKERRGEMWKTYLNQKVAERWLGGQLPHFQSIDMDFGAILEEDILPWYHLEFGVRPERVGLITTDDGSVGCSPDGWLPPDSGIEAKCPRAETHVKYLRSNTVPNDHLVQVHAAMYVTGATSWRFVSYHRRFPQLVVQVQRDEEIIDAIHEAVTRFNEELNEAYTELETINGGPPRRQCGQSIREIVQDTQETYPEDVPV